jgi:hypothetical protein
LLASYNIHRFRWACFHHGELHTKPFFVSSVHVIESNARIGSSGLRLHSLTHAVVSFYHSVLDESVAELSLS